MADEKKDIKEKAPEDPKLKKREVFDDIRDQWGYALIKKFVEASKKE